MPPRTLEQLKKDKEFDSFLANIITDRLKQESDLDRDKLRRAIYADVNPRMHNELPDQITNSRKF
jgi:hypothetical protein